MSTTTPPRLAGAIEKKIAALKDYLLYRGVSHAGCWEAEQFVRSVARLSAMLDVERLAGAMERACDDLAVTSLCPGDAPVLLARLGSQEGEAMMGDRPHPWDNHDDSCECHIGICGDCGCTNEYVALQPLDVERLARAIAVAFLDTEWQPLPYNTAENVLAERIAATYARLGSQEGSAENG